MLGEARQEPNNRQFHCFFPRLQYFSGLECFLSPQNRPTARLGSSSDRNPQTSVDVGYNENSAQNHDTTPRHGVNSSTMFIYSVVGDGLKKSDNAMKPKPGIQSRGLTNKKGTQPTCRSL